MRSLVLALLMGVSFVAQAETESQSVSLRTYFGPTFFSNVAPVSSGMSAAAEVGLGFTENFSLNALFSYAWGSGEHDDTNIGTVSQHYAFFGLNPSLGIRRPHFHGSFGVIAGAMLRNSSVRVYSPSSDQTSSTTQAAVGLNAHLDVPIAGGFFFSLSPEFLQSLGPGSLGSAAIRGGFGFTL